MAHAFPDGLVRLVPAGNIAVETIVVFPDERRYRVTRTALVAVGTVSLEGEQFCEGRRPRPPARAKFNIAANECVPVIDVDAEGADD